MTRTVNYLLYQSGWFAAVLGAGAGYAWAGSAAAALLLAVHLGLATRRADEAWLACAVAAMGVAVDTLQVSVGTLRFSAGLLDPALPPVWLVLLWAQFATTLHFSLSWLLRDWKRAALFGAVGGPIAFAAGARLGAVHLADPVWHTLLLLSASWAIALPVARLLAARQQARPGAGTYRWQSR